jgi:hypothetical protein
MRQVALPGAALSWTPSRPFISGREVRAMKIGDAVTPDLRARLEQAAAENAPTAEDCVRLVAIAETIESLAHNSPVRGIARRHAAALTD